VRTVTRATANAVLGLGLGASLGLGLIVGLGPAPAPRLSVVAKDFTASRILVGPPYAEQVQGQVAPDATLTVDIMVEPIDDPAAPAGHVDISIDMSEVATSVMIVGLSPDCHVATLSCTIQLPDVTPPVPVTPQAIALQAAPGALVGPAGNIHLSWALNDQPAPTTATIEVVVIPAQTPTASPTTNPPPTTATTPPTTPAVIKPRPTMTAPRPSPSATASPTPAVTMTPDPTPPPIQPGDDPLAGPPPAPITFATPPEDRPAWRSPALILSLGTAAGGLLIALAYAIISLRKAAKD
jgi:hypothetical protein